MIKYIKIGVILLIGILLIHNYSLSRRVDKLLDRLQTSISNEKAFISLNSLLQKENREFKFTVELLSYYNDSILLKLDSVRRELDIKDKNLKSLEYLLSEANKKDTIRFNDTIFVNDTKIDTTLNDRWYNLSLSLNYPNTIIVNPKFISEKYIIARYKKETINPPKKCWLGRLFQKKQRVVTVEVVEENPYIKSKQQRFIEIIR